MVLEYGYVRGAGKMQFTIGNWFGQGAGEVIIDNGQFTIKLGKGTVKGAGNDYL